MIVRIKSDNSVVVITSIQPEEEDKFLQANSTGTLIYRKVTSLPESMFGFYKYNPETDTIETDTAKELEKVKELQIKELHNKFDIFRYKTGRMKSAALNGAIVNSREKDAVNIDNLLIVIPADYTGNLNYRLYDNTFVSITRSQLEALRTEIAKYGLDCYQYKWSLEQQIRNATDIQTVLTIEWDDEYVVNNISPYVNTTV